MSDNPLLEAAIAEARAGLAEGGIPIGSVLLIEGEIVGRGRNQRVQMGSATLHAEMHCLENAGRLRAADYQRSTIVSTLSPCDMCSGAILLYGIPIVVIGESTTFRGPEDYLRDREAWSRPRALLRTSTNRWFGSKWPPRSQITGRPGTPAASGAAPARAS